MSLTCTDNQALDLGFEHGAQHVGLLKDGSLPAFPCEPGCCDVTDQAPVRTAASECVGTDADQMLTYLTPHQECEGHRMSRSPRTPKTCPATIDQLVAPLSFSRSCNGTAGLRARHDCCPPVEGMTWRVVSPGPGGAVGDADERPDYRPAERNARPYAGGRSA
jgi:hypothetical protein